ncbi:hypothetical protein PInf_024724 [Phytophthora infestans]|nr:hypothetical protein PInf_024724 [Phytophthora infestans]
MPKQQARREAQSTGRCIRARPHVDYLLAGREFIHDFSSDEDYVDDPLITVEDIANEDADMEGQENEACDDARKVDALPGGKDTGAVAGENDSASGEKSVAAGEKDVATGEKDVATGEKDVAASENDDATSVAAGEKDVAAGENDDAASVAAGEKDVAAGENDDVTSVAAGEKDDAAREKASP